MILPDVVWHVFNAGSGGYTKVRRGGGEEAGGGGGEPEGGYALPRSNAAADSGRKVFP